MPWRPEEMSGSQALEIRGDVKVTSHALETRGDIRVTCSGDPEEQSVSHALFVLGVLVCDFWNMSCDGLSVTGKWLLVHRDRYLALSPLRVKWDAGHTDPSRNHVQGNLPCGLSPLDH